MEISQGEFLPKKTEEAWTKLILDIASKLDDPKREKIRQKLLANANKLGKNIATGAKVWDIVASVASFTIGIGILGKLKVTKDVSPQTWKKIGKPLYDIKAKKVLAGSGILVGTGSAILGLHPTQRVAEKVATTIHRIVLKSKKPV